MNNVLTQCQILDMIHSESVQSTLIKYNIKTLLVFGSVITDNFTSESDVDLAIISDSALSLDSILELEMYFQSLLKREIDILDLRNSSLDLFVKIDILNTGKIIYSNDNNILFNSICDETDRYYRENENFMYFRKVDLLS